MSRHYTVKRCAGCGAIDPTDDRCGSPTWGTSWRPLHTLLTLCTECGAKGEDELRLPCLRAAQREEPRGQTPEADREATARYHGFYDRRSGQGDWDGLMRAIGLGA